MVYELGAVLDHDCDQVARIVDKLKLSGHPVRQYIASKFAHLTNNDLPKELLQFIEANIPIDQDGQRECILNENDK